ncbi:hypothetical protein ILUMI_00946 [Ignelater luminosus]|uniref:Mpv17-like protein 2 n=1 Tax=Ignelater luminosus TaxID=2038154 RepID=A0A8K0DKM1_IGNLU|nr:hypothetical protein ILUMI_00946 [Ignelater luminosus]
MISTMVGLSHVARQLHKTVVQKISRFTDRAFSEKYLLFTNLGISFTLSGVGDVIEQQYEIFRGTLKEWDKLRTRKMAISGVTVGIMCHYYYALLDKRLPGRSISVLVKKVFIDQVICSPLCISVFLVTVAYLEGSTMKQFIEDLKRKGWRLYCADWVVWPPAQFINFYFIAPKYRVLYDSTISLGYDIYTSYVNHDKDAEDEEES